MGNDRRTFLKQLGGLTLGMTTAPLFNEVLAEELRTASTHHHQLTPDQIAKDEPFWTIIRNSFVQSKDFINLENGYFSPQPQSTLDQQTRYNRQINQIPSFYMRTRQVEEKGAVKKKLAQFAGCNPEELVITRNTTESLDTLISGWDLKAGDEAIVSSQDYGSMLAAFDQQARRYGIVNRVIDLPLHPKNDQEIVMAFEKAITDKTKVMQITQVINLSGQVLPVKEICAMAKANGVETMVDGAHAFAHLDFKIPDLQCDYFGASLHKWLCAPLGCGILYIKPDKIKNVWPLFGDDEYPVDDIRKLEHIGTTPPAVYLAIADAIDFHELIGSQKKQARLRYLKTYWTEQVKGHRGIELNTPYELERSCALANVTVMGKSPDELAKVLMEDYNIYTVAINHSKINGVRVTPHLYTSIEELDQLVRALKAIAA